MALTLCSDLGVADWLVRSGTDAEQLINFGPSGFEAYARLRFIPDPSHPGQSEADVVVQAAHLSDIAQTERALRILGRFSGSPSDWFFCVWDGFSDVELPTGSAASSLQLPHRRYVILQGALDEISTWNQQLGRGRVIAPPAFAWPADQTCCFAADVDAHWAGIGASQSTIDALVQDEVLDITPANPTATIPEYQ